MRNRARMALSLIKDWADKTGKEEPKEKREKGRSLKYMIPRAIEICAANGGGLTREDYNAYVKQLRADRKEAGRDDEPFDVKVDYPDYQAWRRWCRAE